MTSNEQIRKDLTKIVEELKSLKPREYPKTVNVYLTDILTLCVGCTDLAYTQAIKAYYDLKMNTKPLNYFIAVVKGKQKDIDDQKQRESLALGDVPDII